MLKDKTRDLIQEIKSRSSLKDIVERDHPLTWKGAIPFAAVRPERTPSFAIYGNRWHDYGTGEGGDVYDYVMMRDRVDLFDAVRTVADTVGLVFDPWEGEDEHKKNEFFAHRRVQAIQTQIVLYMHGTLLPEVREYLRQHYGFSDQTIDELSIGWSDGSAYNYFREEKLIDEDLLLSTGFFYRSGEDVIDHFRRRIVFPYWANDYVVYACARHYEPLTLNQGSNDGRVEKYKKLMTHRPAKGDDPGRTYVSPYVTNEWFYNEDAVKDRPTYVVITEGVTDCISLKQYGFPTISPVAIRFREEDHPKMLALLGETSEVYLCNDNDVTPDGRRPGWEGALATAKFLFSKGKDVKRCELPKPSDQKKIDVNEFLRASSDPKAEFQEVLKKAKRLPDVLLDAMPSDMDPVALDVRLREFADSLAGISPTLLLECVKKVALKYQLPPSDVKTLLKKRTEAAVKAKKKEEEEADKQKKKAQDEARKSLPPKPRDSGGTGPTTGDELRGIVKEDLGFYYVVTPFGQETVSTFTLSLKNVIQDERGMVVVTDIHLLNGSIIRDFVWPRTAWTSKRSFISAFPSVKMQFTGSDDNVQGLLRRLTADATDQVVNGTSVIGYHEVSGEGRFVVPTGTLSENGWMKEPDIVYIDTGCSLAKRISFERDKVEEGKQVAAQALPLLLQVNELSVVLPILGHCFATVFKPRIQEIMGHFPLLSVWGSQGSGKTSIIKDVFWRLQGVLPRQNPFSVTDTPFVLQKNMASSNAIWTPFDEYKPADMRVKEKEILLRNIRRAYSGEANERGRQDQTTNTLPLHSPIVIMGESAIEDDPAISERMIPVSPKKGSIGHNNAYANAYGLLCKLKLHLIAPVYAHWALTADVAGMLEQAESVYEQNIEDKDKNIPPRCKDNMLVLLMGLISFESFAEYIGVSVDVSRSEFVAAIRKTQKSIAANKDGDMFDQILRDFQTMASDQYLRHGINFKVDIEDPNEKNHDDEDDDDSDKSADLNNVLSINAAKQSPIEAVKHVAAHGRPKSRLFIHLPSCIAQYHMWVNAQKITDVAMIGRKAIQRMLNEKKSLANSYILKLNSRIHMSTGAKAVCISIDMEQMYKSIKGIGEFPDRDLGPRKLENKVAGLQLTANAICTKSLSTGAVRQSFQRFLDTDQQSSCTSRCDRLSTKHRAHAKW